MDIIHRGLADIIDRQAQKINELQAKLDKAVEALKLAYLYAQQLDCLWCDDSVGFVCEACSIEKHLGTTLKELGVE